METYSNYDRCTLKKNKTYRQTFESHRQQLRKRYRDILRSDSIIFYKRLENILNIESSNNVFEGLVKFFKNTTDEDINLVFKKLQVLQSSDIFISAERYGRVNNLRNSRTYRQIVEFNATFNRVIKQRNMNNLINLLFKISRI